MPTRILRDWTDSDRFDGISAEAERLFVRLLMKADDYGRFVADGRRVRSACFPLILDLRTSDIDGWLRELAERHLIWRYERDNRSLLAIPRFRQRLKRSVPKFPPPTGKPDDWLPDSDMFPEVPGSSRNIPESPPHTETETYSDSETKTDAETVQKPSSFSLDEDPLESQIREYIGAHAMLTWNAKTHEKCRELVKAVGWGRAKILIEEGLAAKAPFPIGWALGKAANEYQRSASGPPKPASRPLKSITKKIVIGDTV